MKPSKFNISTLMPFKFDLSVLIFADGDPQIPR